MGPNRGVIARLKPGQFLLIVGIFIRVTTFIFLAPGNNDAHIDVVRFILAHHRLPLNTELEQAYHPPLYYLIATLFLKLFGTDKGVQLLSLIFSIATIGVLYVLIYKVKLIQEPRLQFYSFLLACLLPQFVMFSLYVSNDTLAIFLGALLVLQSYRFIARGTFREILLLAVLAGLGLLTKATFLAFVPVLAALVVFRYFKADSTVKGCWAAAGFLSVALSLGSYKYVDDYLRYRNPFISNADHAWALKEKQEYMGVRSYVDMNILQLLKSPTDLKPGGTASAFPILAYGTFWYQYIPESNFIGDVHRPSMYLGSLIYAVAIFPTVMFVIGLCGLAWRLPAFIRTFDYRDSKDCATLLQYLAVCLFLANVGLMVTALAKYHLPSISQARLLFPAFAGALAAFATGLEIIQKKAILGSLGRTSVILLCLLFGLYLATEIGYQVIAAYFHPVLRYLPAIRSFLRRV